MYTFLISIHVVLCISLIGLVLLQHGKGADMGATFGSGSNTVFGAGGAATVVTRITTGLAIGFMVTSLLLARFQDSMVVSGPSSPLTGSVLEDEVAVPVPVDDVAVVPRPDSDSVTKANPPPAANPEAGKPAAEAAVGEQPKTEVVVPAQPASSEPVAKTEEAAPAAVAPAIEPAADSKKASTTESKADSKSAKK